MTTLTTTRIAYERSTPAVSTGPGGGRCPKLNWKDVIVQPGFGDKYMIVEISKLERKANHESTGSYKSSNRFSRGQEYKKHLGLSEPPYMSNVSPRSAPLLQ
jgi:hypothetical protein